MADPANILVHLLGDAERQRHLARMQQIRHETAASQMLKVAITLQEGATLNTLKGTLPFALRNVSRGLGTTVALGSPLGGVNVYAAAPPAPVRARQRRRRGRRL